MLQGRNNVSLFLKIFLTKILEVNSASRNLMSNNFELLTIDQAAQFLNIKVSKLRREVFQKKIPHLKLGALVRFKKEALIAWAESKLVMTHN
jgi:excisionase family DNA binding protein